MITWFVLRILFVFALVIAFLLTERRFAFDLKQRAIIFVTFFALVYIGLIMGIYVLAEIVRFFSSSQQ